MKIVVEKSGGFAGVTARLAEVDTESAGDRDRLEGLVRELDFFSLPPRVDGEVGADLEELRLTVDDAGRSHTVSFPATGGSVQADALRRIAEAASS